VGNNGSIDGAVNSSSAPYPYPTVAEPNNPTVIPKKILEQFHFAFLIRHPVHSIPSYWRCTIPPLDDITGFHNFMPEEAGYDEQRRVFDYLKNEGIIGPAVAGQSTNGNGHSNGESGNEICVIDADDLLNDPEGIMRKFCASVGIDFEPTMLEWDTPEDHKFAKDKFEKWRGFHEDAINSSGLKARTHVSLFFSLEKSWCIRVTDHICRENQKRLSSSTLRSGKPSTAMRLPRSFRIPSSRMLPITST